MYRAYVLYQNNEPAGFAVCSEDQYPEGHYQSVGHCETQGDAETLAEDAFIDALFVWANEGL